jgi:hypothetical protein
MDDTKTATTHVEEWTPITPGDLGLKVGFWSGRAGDEVRFEPIAAWAAI